MGKQLKNKHRIKFHSLNKPLLMSDSCGCYWEIISFFNFFTWEKHGLCLFSPLFHSLGIVFVSNGHNQAGYNHSFKSRPRHIPPLISKALFSKLLLDTTGMCLRREILKILSSLFRLGCSVPCCDHANIFKSLSKCFLPHRNWILIFCIDPWNLQHQNLLCAQIQTFPGFQQGF